MKITYLVGTAHGLGSTASTIMTQANAMARFHQVEIVSVYRSQEPRRADTHPDVLVRDLVTVSEDGAIRLDNPGLLTPDDAAALHGMPSLLTPAPWDPTLDALADVGLEDALPRIDADVLVTVTPALLALACQLAPTDTAIVHHEHRISSQPAAGTEPLLAFGPRADVIALLSESMAHFLAERLGPAAPEIVVVPHAIPPGYRPRSRLDNPLIVAAGHLVREKQFVQMVSAFARISDRIPDWRLRVFGEGNARYELKGAIRKHGLFDRVELPGTTVDLASEWAKASISALTSTNEGFPLVIQEAMAAGVPVVSYDCPSGPRAIIDHGVDGLLVAQGSEVGMASALLQLATDPALRNSLGRAALEKAATFDTDIITRRWMDILETAVERHRGAAGGRSLRRISASRTAVDAERVHQDQRASGCRGHWPDPGRGPDGRDAARNAGGRRGERGLVRDSLSRGRATYGRGLDDRAEPFPGGAGQRRGKKSRQGYQAYTTPLVVKLPSGDQVISPGAFRAISYDPRNGKELWHVTYGEGFSNVPRPVYADGLVFICTGFQQASLLAVSLDGKGDVTKSKAQWKLDRGVPLTPSPLLCWQ